ncbi:MAG: TIGR04282 family arsenosugar biosynthesis glycosyltransferase [Pseudomonadota bacterium]
MRPTLIIMLKEPRPGRVKTRLGREIGMTTAAWWFRHQAQALLRRLGPDPRWTTVLAVSPDHAGLTSRCWPPRFARVPQGSGDLGMRMAHLLRSAPPGPALIIGADIPGIRARHITRAFALLGAHDAVLGPAPDGGYWCVGLRRTAAVPTRLFSGVRWSTETALDDTLVSLGPARVALTDCLADVDTVADLNKR